MSAVGTLIFCTSCGNLLDSISHQKSLQCEVCHSEYDATKFSKLKVVTHTDPEAFPSPLKLKKSAVKTSIGKDEVGEGATIKEICPQCGHDEMQYHTLQLRSADEGATVFYTCTKCGYKYRTNN